MDVHERALSLVLVKSPGEGCRIKLKLTIQLADDTLEDVLGGVADELDAFANGLRDLDLFLSLFAKIEWLAWNTTVIK